MKKLKITAYIIFILTLALIFSSCQSETTEGIASATELTDGTKVKLANNDAVDFYFYYPENWIISRDDLMLTIYANDLELTRPNISAWAFTPDVSAAYKTIDAYWKEFAVPELEVIFPDIEKAVVQERTVDGVAAKKYTYTGMGYKISQIVVLKNRQVYILTYTATEDKYDTHSEVLDIVADTFKFK